MNWIIGVAFAWVITMLGVCWSDAQTKTAKYECIAKVSTTLDAEKAKELCK